MDGQGYVDAAAAHVLSNNEILMASPSSAQLSAFYPTPAESTNTIAQAVCNSGQLVVKANSKTFPGSSDFQVSTGNILDSPFLSMVIRIPALVHAQAANLYVASWSDGWGYDLIDSVEVSYSNSNISNLIITGQALRDWSLLQCKNKAERRDLLAAAGRMQIQSRAADRYFRATMPISFLNWAGAGGTHGGFPLDARTLNGSIQFQFHFRNLGASIGPVASSYIPDTVPGDAGTAIVVQYGPGTDSGFPSSFNELEMTFRTYQLMDSAFSVSHALQANPGMIYSIPAKWVNTYRYQVDVTPGNKAEIQLNSAPAGMIQCMLLNIRPIARVGNVATPTKMTWDYEKVTASGRDAYNPARYGSLPLSSLRLQYSGQSIFDAHTEDQLNAYYKFIFCDDLITDIPTVPQHLSIRDGEAVTELLSNQPDRVCILHNSPLHLIPLMHNGNSIFRFRHFENLPHYSGSTLSLQFTPELPKYKANPYPSHSNPTVVTTGGAERATNLDLLHSGAAMTKRTIATGAITAPALWGADLDFDRVEVSVTYVVAALLQSTNGVVELQL